MRRSTPELLVATLIMVLIGWCVWYTHSLYLNLRADARRSTDMYARVYHAFSDTSSDATTRALYDLSRSIRDQGVPLILTDGQGNPTAHANLPFPNSEATSDDDPRVREYIPILANSISRSSIR